MIFRLRMAPAFIPAGAYNGKAIPIFYDSGAYIFDPACCGWFYDILFKKGGFGTP